jgi:hypothetical protein
MPTAGKIKTKTKERERKKKKRNGHTRNRTGASDRNRHLRYSFSELRWNAECLTTTLRDFFLASFSTRPVDKYIQAVPPKQDPLGFS